MQSIVEALNSINYSLTHPTRWEIASVIISAVSLILTVVVLFYNHRSISLAQKSIKQAVDLQLYEKRLELFKHLSEQDAFKNVPIEIKIVFSDSLYDLYADISILCQKRWEKIYECYVLGIVHEERISPFYNLCTESMKEINQVIVGKIQVLKKSPVTYRQAEALITQQSEINNFTEQITEKINTLEKMMSQIIKKSIENER